MSNVIETLERGQLRDGIPQFKAGDTVRVHFRVIEGQRSRIQVFEGIVIKRQGSGARETFTVRKQSFGVGVERTFPLHSPKIDKIEVVAIGGTGNMARGVGTRLVAGGNGVTLLEKEPGKADALVEELRSASSGGAQ